MPREGLLLKPGILDLISPVIFNFVLETLDNSKQGG